MSTPPTDQVNSPHVIFFLLIIAVLVVMAVVIADLVQAFTRNRRARLREKRNDLSIFKAAEEARSDFS